MIHMEPLSYEWDENGGLKVYIWSSESIMINDDRFRKDDFHTE